MRTYTIPETSQAALIERMEKLGRSAAKLNLAAPTHKITGAELRNVYRDGNPLRTWDGRLIKERWLVIEVDEPIVKLPGWDFLGTVQHTDHGNILRTLPGAQIEEGELLPFRERASTCDHCATNRRRNDTYLVRRAGDRQIMQVGSGCMNDFLGADILASLQFVSERCGLGDLEEGSTGGGHATWCWSMDEVLALASAAIRMVGWVSATVARGSQATSTASVVTAFLTASDDAARARLGRDYPKVWDAVENGMPAIDTENALATKAWARAIAVDTTNDYLHNLRVACAASEVSFREIGLVVSAVAAWHRDNERELAAKRTAGATSGWLGNVGDKVGKKLSAKDKKTGAAAIPEQTGEVSALRTFDTDFGVKTMVKVVTDYGETIVWFATGSLDLVAGQRVSIAGTIKKLGEFRGVKETVLTRATVQALAA